MCQAVCQASAKLVPGPQYLGRNARAHSKHTSAFGAEMSGVGLPIRDGFRGSRTRLGLFLYVDSTACMWVQGQHGTAWVSQHSQLLGGLADPMHLFKAKLQNSDSSKWQSLNCTTASRHRVL